MVRLKLAACFAFALFLVSCVTQTVWDASYAEEEMSTVLFTWMKPTGYNGIPVSKWAKVKIPAGVTLIEGDVTLSHAGLMILVRGMEFSFNFEAEKEYEVIGVTQDMLWGVKVYEGTRKTGTEIAFIPFRNQPVFN
jgi:hypothetical protein